MTRRAVLEREIERVFIPYVVGKGFASDIPSQEDISRRAAYDWNVPDDEVELSSAPCDIYRRVVADEVQVFGIQWDRYGRPRFVVEFGTAPLEGVEHVIGGRVAPRDILPSQAPVRGRLAPGSGTGRASWFRQDRLMIERLMFRSSLRPPEQVISQLVTLFAELEEFWNAGTVGPHMRLLPSMHQLAARAKARPVAMAS